MFPGAANLDEDLSMSRVGGQTVIHHAERDVSCDIWGLLVYEILSLYLKSLKGHDACIEN